MGAPEVRQCRFFFSFSFVLWLCARSSSFFVFVSCARHRALVRLLCVGVRGLLGLRVRCAACSASVRAVSAPVCRSHTSARSATDAPVALDPSLCALDGAAGDVRGAFCVDFYSPPSPLPVSCSPFGLSHLKKRRK